MFIYLYKKHLNTHFVEQDINTNDSILALREKKNIKATK